MKTQSPPFPLLRTLGLAIVIAGALSSTASAVVLTDFRAEDTTTGQPVPAHDWVDGIANVSNMVGHGTVVRGTGATVKYIGWADTANTTDYAGFTIYADSGKSLNFENITHGIGSSPNAAADLNTFYFGYRVDPENDGTFSAWTFTSPLVPGDAEFAFSTTSNRVWELNFSTTGAAEFAMFGSSGGGIRSELFALATGGSVTVNGSVTAVPEPSTVLLGVIGAVAVAACVRRRRTLANS